jgi:hypothetical protein
MHQTLEAIVDEHGHIRLLETIPLPTGRRVLVTILEEEQIVPINEVTLLSEAAEARAAKVQELIGIASVALAGVIQVSVTEGPFNFWNIMIGIPLLLILSVFSGSHKLDLNERAALGAIWGFTLTSAMGLLFQTIYRFRFGLQPLLPPFPGDDAKWEAPGGYYLVIWAVLSIGAYLYFTLRQKERTTTRKKVAKD